MRRIKFKMKRGGAKMGIDGTVYLKLMGLSGSLPLSPIDFLAPFSNTSAITQLLIPMCSHILQILMSLKWVSKSER